MDSSLNMIDLEYLTNRTFLKKRKMIVKDNFKEDLTFYRKRVFQLTKDFLCGKYINAELDNAFKNYTKTCMDHFKFLDHSDIIQKDYSKIKIRDKKEPKKLNHQQNVDYLLMHTMQPVTKKITDCIPIHRKSKEKKTFMPKNRNINLRDPKFRSKGLSKKNVHNKYGKAQDKKKKTSS
jgi:hypothetical protein